MRLAADQRAALIGREVQAAHRRVGERRPLPDRRLRPQNLAADLPHAARRRARDARANHLVVVREPCAGSASASPGSTTFGSAVLRHRPVVGGERLVASPCRASRWRGSPGSGSADRDSSSARARSAASSESSPSSVHSAWMRASWFACAARHRPQRAGDADLSCSSTSSFCAVSRHQPFGCSRCATSCAGVSLYIRGRWRSGGVLSWVIRQMRPQLWMLVELVLLDLAPQVGVRTDELRVLDDAGVHVDEHQRAVRRVVNRRPAGTADRSSARTPTSDRRSAAGSAPRVTTTLARRTMRPTGSLKKRSPTRSCGSRWPR